MKAESLKAIDRLSHRKGILETIDRSRRRRKLDVIDIVLFHSVGDRSDSTMTGSEADFMRPP